jgi:ectoine hydroxylase-related dioxygenase (phytanoyl-CoA dioxygenase family)
MSVVAAAPTPRSITDDEVAFFEENGWVKLEQFIPTEAAAGLLARVQEKMGGERVTATSHPNEQLKDRNTKGTRFHTYAPLSVDACTGEVLDEAFHAFSHSHAMGEAAAKLCGEPVRFLIDQALVKAPVSFDNASGETAWHVDISGRDDTPFENPNKQVLLWLALNDVPAERGAMRFVAPRNITEEVWRVVRENTLLDSYATLEQQGLISPPLNFKAGDATVHSGATLHSAPANMTDEARWVFNQSMFPARATWTGAGSGLAIPDVVQDPKTGTRLEAGKGFPDFRFALLA